MPDLYKLTAEIQVPQCFSGSRIKCQQIPGIVAAEK
jgi:hypothetical protein